MATPTGATTNGVQKLWFLLVAILAPLLISLLSWQCAQIFKLQPDLPRYSHSDAERNQIWMQRYVDDRITDRVGLSVQNGKRLDVIERELKEISRKIGHTLDAE